MMRSLLVALATVVAVSASVPAAELQNPSANQTSANPVQFPLNFNGGTPGIQIDVFMNGGKAGDTMLDTTGSGNFLLDLANLGKTRIDIYVDVCKDGKVVKVLFVSGGGAAPPEDEDCDRRIAAVSFQSDCGVTRINFDFRNFGARVMGCAAMYTRPQVYLPAAGAAAAIPLLLAGGGSSGVATTPQTPQQPTVITPSLPPTNTTTPTAPPTTPPTTPATPTAAGNYTCVAFIIVQDNGRHNPFINLGPGLTGVFVVTVGSITIRHPAPFIDIANAQYDVASGQFSGDGRGTVAGFPNVGVRAEGTVNVNTGRIEFNYTMGTGGELPGGQPIIYRITLQKQ